ncbi:transporter substrate-binding domain-containing protein [Roseateles sp. DAIF2]|uniref:ATP-binding protein n=1 Tax=Roseateles sp. DAIF2 TaxID=2714952 RepID=UPI0018A28BCE|nr:transporter substrate-binding domain-containing protein [Roseateles sp. DAIF2]QPF74982.1 transporter substrate-binding domain-containing protein [Roseateles sp. DAIF2]
MSVRFLPVLLLVLANWLSAAPARAADWLTAEERAWIAQHRQLRVAGVANYGPFTFTDEEGRVRGLSADYAERLSRLTGLELRFQPPQTFARNVELLKQGELDINMSLRATPERLQYLGFTRPYITVPAVLLRRVDGAGESLGTLRPGEPVSVGRSYAVGDFLRERYPGNPLQVEPDDKMLLRRLAGGEIGAAVADLAVTTYLLRSEGIGNVRVVDDVGFAYELGIGYRRDWPMLGRILDKALARIAADERQAIADRWMAQESEGARWQRRWLMAAAAGLALALLGAGLLLGWNRTLQRQVLRRTEQLKNELAERERLQDADRARELAELANKTKTEFMSQASHELRTPLNAVLGFSQLLADDPQRPLDALQRERLAHIENAARHQLALIDDMMTLSRLEAGSLAVRTLPVEAGPLLRRCVAMFEPAARAAGIALRLEDCESTALPRVQADPVRLEQVLLNLLSNAIKYNRPGGWVRVFACADAGFHIGVEDGGLGLSPEQQAQLFQPFNRLGRSEQEGTGIGLVICKQLMERMGGAIRVQSQPGQGSCFTLDLRNAA